MRSNHQPIRGIDRSGGRAKGAMNRYSQFVRLLRQLHNSGTIRYCSRSLACLAVLEPHELRLVEL